MGDIYRVKAPYVTLKSKSETGADVVLGYYAGAILPESVDLEDLARHIRKDMVEKLEGDEAAAVEEQKAEEAEAAADIAEVKDEAGEAAVEAALEQQAEAKAEAEDDADEAEDEAEAEEEPATGVPAASASKADWVAYAVSLGVDQAEAEAKTKADLVAEYGG